MEEKEHICENCRKMGCPKCGGPLCEERGKLVCHNLSCRAGLVDKMAYPDLVEPPVEPRQYPYTIPEHELHPKMGCNCYWCIESGSKPGKTNALVAPGIVVDFPEWCPECGAPSDDPEGCWSCGYDWEDE